MYPNVAIVGRMNVGKSTLFNRLTKTKQSLVFPQEGVTRDYIENVVVWNDKFFNLIDTGGLPLTKHTDKILQEVEKSVLSIVESADLILFVCDGKNGLIEQDRQLAKILHKKKKPVFLLLNKSDNISAFREHEHEFLALGFKNIFCISATHGTGVRELLDAVTDTVQAPDKDVLPAPETLYQITILGKPNVGKSSLLNLLIKKHNAQSMEEKAPKGRAIVSEVAGTTREAITEQISFHKDIIKVTDTPGIRKKARVDEPLEQAMVKSALQAVRSADIILAVIDSTEGHLADQELKLLFYAYEQKKSIILVLNKTDILTEEQKDKLKYDMERYEFFIKKVPIVWISCKTEKNIGNVLKEIQKARRRRQTIFDEAKVHEIIKESFIRKPMYHKRQLLKILNVKVAKRPIPTIILNVNYPQWFGPTQLGYIENQLRRNYDLLGCPVDFILQKV